MKVINLISKAVSLIIAIIEIVVVYCDSLPRFIEHYKNRSFGRQDAIIFTAPILIFGVFSLIWFGDSIAESAQEKQEWCHPLLVKIFGWFFLLIIGYFIYGMVQFE